MRAQWVHRAAAVALVLLLAGCGSGEDRPGQITADDDEAATTSGSGDGDHGGHGGHGKDGEAAFDETDANTVIDVRMVDFAFQGLPRTVAGPNVLIRVTNDGPADHELLVRRDGDDVGGVHAFGPATTKRVALRLDPGTYTVECLVAAGSKTHAQLGMKQTLTVT